MTCHLITSLTQRTDYGYRTRKKYGNVYWVYLAINWKWSISKRIQMLSVIKLTIGSAIWLKATFGIFFPLIALQQTPIWYWLTRCTSKVFGKVVSILPILRKTYFTLPNPSIQWLNTWGSRVISTMVSVKHFIDNLIILKKNQII